MCIEITPVLSFACYRNCKGDLKKSAARWDNLNRPLARHVGSSTNFPGAAAVMFISVLTTRDILPHINVAAPRNQSRSCYFIDKTS